MGAQAQRWLAGVLAREWRQRTAPHLFASKTEAKRWLDDNLTRGRLHTPLVQAPETTFAEHLDRYLRTHAATVQPATIRDFGSGLAPSPRAANRKRSGRGYRTAVEPFGGVKLTDLERMSGAIAEWQATLPAAYRYAIVRSLRQVLEAAVRWNLIRTNPAKQAGPNPQPPREEVAFFESLADVDLFAVELGRAGETKHRTTVPMALSPSSVSRPAWAVRMVALERRDIDRKDEVVQVRRSIVDRTVKEHGKTTRSRRDVPLTARAIAALDEIPARIDTPLLFPSRGGGFIDLDNWRRREWRPSPRSRRR